MIRVKSELLSLQDQNTQNVKKNGYILQNLSKRTFLKQQINWIH